MKRQTGFTLVELMIVVAILGVLAAISIPNFIAMQDRAKEGVTRANMHTFQVTAEDYGVQNNGFYADDAALIAPLLPVVNFENPFSHLPGDGESWEDRGSVLSPSTPKPGITSYADSSAQTYNIKGFGKSTSIPLVLTSGQ